VALVALLIELLKLLVAVWAFVGSLFLMKCLRHPQSSLLLYPFPPLTEVAPDVIPIYF
jgi:hypothetical protein